MAENNLTKEQRRNATPSWSGYLHQGKVGILVALKYIDIEFFKNAPAAIESFRHLHLTYEHHEDFMVLKDNEILSIHQVKAKISAGSDKKSAYGSALKQFDVSTSPLDQRYLHVVNEITDWDKSKTANIHKIQLYEYADSRKYSSLNDDSIKNEAMNYIAKLQPSRSVDEVEAIYFELLNILIDKVRGCHARSDHSHPIISFEEIFECIENPIIDNIKHNFEINKIKTILVRALNETEQDFEINNEDKGLHWEQASNVIEELCKLEGNDLISSLSLLHPDDLDFFNSKNVKYDGLKNIFIEVLRSVPSYNQANNSYLKDTENYFLSNISEMSRNARSTAIRILTNPNNTKLIFEGRNIVTKELEGSFVNLLGSHEQAYENNIIKPEMLKFIKVEDALLHLMEEVE